MAGTVMRSGCIGSLGALIIAAVLMSAGHPRGVIMAAAGGLATSDVEAIISQGVAAANTTASADGLRSSPGNKRATKMVIAVVARDGKLLKVYAQPDAWVGSQDIAIAKARTAAFFSSDENALTSRIIGVLSQAHNPDGSGGAGPLWGIGNSNQIGITGSQEFRNGLITFPGGVPLYRGGLVGGVGVSGDAVDQDEAVAFAAAVGFAPGAGVVTLGMTPPVVPPFP
jgi:uncharacterized protein GlcG (DUF336 family)